MVIEIVMTTTLRFLERMGMIIKEAEDDEDVDGDDKKDDPK